jgi:hypothetical protein
MRVTAISSYLKKKTENVSFGCLLSLLGPGEGGVLNFI